MKTEVDDNSYKYLFCIPRNVDVKFYTVVFSVGILFYIYG